MEGWGKGKEEVIKGVLVILKKCGIGTPSFLKWRRLFVSFLVFQLFRLGSGEGGYQ